MKHTLENGTLTIFLEKEMNSYTSEGVEKEIKDIVAQSEFSRIVLDFENLRYISSAGLRVIVALKQQHDDLTLTKMTDDVYDVFDMVGFNNIIKIERLNK